jgi:hypothetical protein
MSKLKELAGKSKIFIIGGIELEFKPRVFETDIDLILDLSKPEKTGNAMKELIKRTLKDAVPDATEEELKNVSFQYFKEITNAIVEINGLKVKDEIPN